MKTLIASILLIILSTQSTSASIGTLGILPGLSKDFKETMRENCGLWAYEGGSSIGCFGNWVLGESSEQIKLAFSYLSKDSVLTNEGLQIVGGATLKITSEEARLAYNNFLESGLFLDLADSIKVALIGTDLSKNDFVKLKISAVVKEKIYENLTFPEIEALNAFLLLVFGYTFYV